MVLKPLEAMTAFRCPNCGACVSSPIGSFTLGGSLYKLKCRCGKSVMQIQAADDNMLRLTVPCLICPNPHYFTISRKLFFGRELFLLDCTYSGFPICFIGRSDKVWKAFDDATEELMSFLNEAGFGAESDNSDNTAGGAVVLNDEVFERLEALKDDDGHDGAEEVFRDDEPNGEYDDDSLNVRNAQDAYDTLSVVLKCFIEELVTENAIRCRCPGSKAGDYTASHDNENDSDGDTVRITCKNCGCSKCYPIRSAEDASAWLEADELDLT